MIKHLQAARSPQWLNRIEAEVNERSRELNRELVQSWLEYIGTGDVGASLKLSDGTELRHRRVLRTTLYTKYGKVTVRRTGYSLPGHACVFPLDAALNLPQSAYSYELQRFIARRVSQSSFEDVLNLTAEVTGLKIGSRQAVEMVAQCACDFDEFYERQGDGVKSTLPVLVLTTDGKGIVMRPDSLRAGTREKARAAKPKLGTRLSRGEKTNRKRMAQVASIYTIERFRRKPEEVVDEFARRQAYERRPRPEAKRVWASVEKESDAVITELFAEAKKRDPTHQKEWVVLIDGQKHQLRQIRSILKQRQLSATIILDIIHVIEYLWLAARLFFEETSSPCERWVEDKLVEILNSRAGKVAGSIRMSAAKAKLTKPQRHVAEKSARYLAQLKNYMDYRTYLEQGYPIATGVIEGACRHLIKDRMDLTGARWTLTGAESVLKLRSLVSSGDFESYWLFHLQQEQQRNYLDIIEDLQQLRFLSSS